MSLVSPLLSSSSWRLKHTEPPFIENVLEKYGNIPNIKILALGSSYWTPPQEALSSTLSTIETSIHKYGAILGDTKLIHKIRDRLSRRGLGMEDQDVVITCGANQAFLNVALTLCDHHQKSIIVAPYYFCHKASLQLAGSDILVCPFTKHDLMPDWKILEEMINSHTTNNKGNNSSNDSLSKISNKKYSRSNLAETTETTTSTSSSSPPIMIVITTPSNPTGAVWSKADIQRLVTLCKPYNIWIVIDQTYEEFYYDTSSSSTSTSSTSSNQQQQQQPHFYPCTKELNYERIIHIFSFSKAYGMPGWRVGYTVAPSSLTDSFRKIQDTIPTCAPMISQKLAFNCLEYDEQFSLNTAAADADINNRVNNNNINVKIDCSMPPSSSSSSILPPLSQSLSTTQRTWVQNQVHSLSTVREAIWRVVEPLGTVKTSGAFYFLVPVPAEITEDEAVDILARQYLLLLMPGTPFGATGYLRLSYGSLSPLVSLEAVQQLTQGFQYLIQLSQERIQNIVKNDQ